MIFSSNFFMFRFFIDRKIEDQNNIVIKEKDIIHKLSKVLRVKLGDVFILFDSDANEYQVQIENISKTQIVGKSLKRSYIERELAVNINLFQALLKKDKFEWVVQKVTEIGVKKIYPILSANCVVKDLNKNKLVRYQKIINEATMQCGGKIPAKINELLEFEMSLKNLNPHDLNLIAHEIESEDNLNNILKPHNKNVINIFIGPEGGFAQEEIDLAQRYSLIPINLGPRILRAETAAIVACSLIANK